MSVIKTTQTKLKFKNEISICKISSKNVFSCFSCKFLRNDVSLVDFKNKIKQFEVYENLVFVKFVNKNFLVFEIKEEIVNDLMGIKGVVVEGIGYDILDNNINNTINTSVDTTLDNPVDNILDPLDTKNNTNPIFSNTNIHSFSFHNNFLLLGKRREMVLFENFEKIKEFPVIDFVGNCLIYYDLIFYTSGFSYYIFNKKSFNLRKEIFKYNKIVTDPLIVVINNNQFLLTTCTDMNLGLGIFVNDSGDPIKSTIQWKSIPTDIKITQQFITALLANNTIQFHNLNSLDFLYEFSITTSPIHLTIPDNIITDSIYIVSKSQIDCLTLYSNIEYINYLLGIGSFREVISFTNTLSNSKIILPFVYKRIGFIFAKDTLFQDAI